MRLSVGKNGRINTIYNVGQIEKADFPTSGLKDPTRSKTETGNTAYDDSISNANEKSNIESTRAGTISNRELLADSLHSTAQTLEEKQRVADYRRAAKNLDEKQAELRDVKSQLRELAFAASSRRYDGTYEAKIAELENKAEKLEKSINWWDKRMLSLEATKPLKDVLARERQQTIRQQNQKAKQNMNSYKDEQARHGYRTRIERNANSLATWLTRPTDTRHVPEELRNRTAEFLKTLDFSHNPDTLTAAAWSSRLESLVSAMEQVNIKAESENRLGEHYGYLDIDPNLCLTVELSLRTSPQKLIIKANGLKRLTLLK